MMDDMMHNQLYKISFCLLLLGALLISCSNGVTSKTAVETLPPAQQYVAATQTQAVVASTQAAIPTLAFTPTPQFMPEAWRLWPVIPEVTQKAREIYKKGIELGNNSHAFSKIGDCQNLHNAFLGFFDIPSRYDPQGRVKPFLDTIANFKGYWARDGESAKFGFTAASPLSPIWANQDNCLPDETPMECELRITKPSFVLISLEYAFKGRNAETYERYMRQIIEYVIAQGAVPILSTKADNMEKDHSINLATARLAVEYNLPLWNWWLAAQPLADHGIDILRDGFHISVQAWNERSFTFLETLDHLWKGLRDIK
jgi:hypothetical protein